MKLVFLIISIFLTVFFPILSLPINLFGMIFTSGKIRKIYAILMAFSLAIMAYVYVPGPTMDLYRHHQELRLFTGFDTAQLFSSMQAEFEPLHYITKFLVAQTGDFNLLQFAIVFGGYFELFWMVCDLAEIKNIKIWMFALLVLYVFSSVRFIDFASGLRFNFAIINLGLGVYLLHFKKKKYLPYVFFLMAITMHIATLLMVVLILLFSKLEIFRKIRLSTIILLAVLALTPGLIVSFSNNILGVDNGFARAISSMYNSYFVNGDENFGFLHTGWNLVFPVINMVIGVLSPLLAYKTSNYRSYCSFVLCSSICVLAFTMNAGVFMRYGFFIAMIALPIILDLLSKVKNIRFLLSIVTMLVLLTSVQFVRSINQMESSGIFSQIDQNVTNNVFVIFEEGK